MHNIRIADTKDITLIRKLTFLIWPQTYASVLSQEQIDFMLEMMYSETSLTKQMNEDGCRFIIVYEDKEPVGFASYSETAHKKWKLHKIYILQTQQGKGTGRFLIDYIINEIKNQGGESIQLQVNRYNKAKEFYEKLGFIVIEEADLEIGNGYFMNDFIMEKQI